jgi:protease-4
MFNTVKLELPGANPSRELYEFTIQKGSGNKVLIIPIEGVISESAGSTLFGGFRPSMLSTVIESIQLAKKDYSIKGVILKIDSPGGTVSGSEIIYKELKKLKQERDIPIVAMFMSTAASGGYYVAMASDRIVALPSNVTGSIGVIMSRFNLKEGLDKLGIKEQSIVSGENKKIGSPFVDMKPEQEKILKGIVDDLYQQFLSVVKEGRKNSNATRITQIADGRIFSSSEALKEGLIDKVGFFEDALQELYSRPNYNGSKSPAIIYYNYSDYNVKNPYQISSIDLDENPLEKILKIQTQTRFLYLWNY